MSSPAVPIIVWCHPRSCSTAFERSFLQRADTKVWHEPLGDPFYYGKQRACRRYSEDECRASEHYGSSVEQVARKVLASSSGDGSSPPPRFVFIKDMAQYVFSGTALHRLHPDSRVFPDTGADAPAKQNGVHANPTELPTALLRRFKHAFLIRTPEKSVPSYWKCVEEGAAGFSFFDGAESGYVEQRLLYDWLSDPNSTFHNPDEPDDPSLAAWPVQSQPPSPPVVDARVLLGNPGRTLQTFCDTLGVPFDPHMLSWDAGAVDIWAKWGTYHTVAQNSTGFRADDGSDEAEKDLSQFPPEVQTTIAYVIHVHMQQLTDAARICRHTGTFCPRSRSMINSSAPARIDTWPTGSRHNQDNPFVW